MRALLKTKTLPMLPTNRLLLAALLTTGVLALSRDAGWAAEVFPTVVIKGEVYTNVSVMRTNPAEVILRWEGGGGGTFKRQDLPPELAARYPYDPKAAEQWAREKAAKARRIAEQERENTKAAAGQAQDKAAHQREWAFQNLRRQESDLKSQVLRAKKQVKDSEDVIKVLDGKAKGTRRRSPAHQEADAARNQKLVLLDQLHQVESQLSGVQEQISRQR